MRSSHRSRQRTVVCDYRCAHLFGLVRRGYPLSQELEAVRHRVSACSEFRVASVSCLFAFLNRVSESFGWFTCSIRSGDVCFLVLLVEVCVGRVCVCKFCANAIFRESFCAFCRPFCVGFRVRPLDRFRFADPDGFRGSCLRWETVDRYTCL